MPHILTQRLMLTTAILLPVSVVTVAASQVASLDNAQGVPIGAMADWKIVLPADAIPSEAYASEELQRFFEQATGILLPTAAEPVAGGRGHIYVGPSEPMLASAIGFDTADFGPEELRVVVGKSAIATAGGRPRGTLYGVYTFLEDCLGIRFLTPDHTHVPQYDANDVLTSMDKSYSPMFEWRFCSSGEIHRNHVFAVRMRSNASFGKIDVRLGGQSPLELMGHSFSRYVPWNTYGKEHPEYFNEEDGKRPTQTRNDHFGPGVQLCTTNADVRKLITEGVLRDLAQQQRGGNISVSQNDNFRYCTCPECMQLNDAAESGMGAVLDLVNEVADAVAEEHPDVLVGTLAYTYSRKPPVGVMPRPNVQIQLCSFEACQIHPLDDPACPMNGGFCIDLTGWGKISDNVFIWHYVANFGDYLVPNPVLRSVGPNIRLFVQCNAKGVFMQGPERGAHLGGLRNYVICNMLWDPTRDENQLMDAFLRLHYGDQAHAVREYVGLLHDAAEGSGLHQNCFGATSDYGLNPDIAHQGRRILEGAMAATDDDAIRTRLERETIGCYGVLVEAVTIPANREAKVRIGHDANYQFALDSDEARAVRPYLAKYLELCSKHSLPQYSEHVSMQVLESVLRDGYGLDDGEEF